MAAIDSAKSNPGVSRLTSHPVVTIVLPLIIAGIAIYVLHRTASHVRWADVKANLAATPAVSLLLAVGATALSFLALSLYDVLSVRSVADGKVPVGVAALAGASGYAVSNLLGFSWLTGSAIRYRIYAAIGLDIGLVAGVFATSWVAFWMGLFLIIGGLLSFHPSGLSAVLPINPVFETWMGALLLSLLAVVFGMLSRGKKQLSVGRFHIKLPTLRLAILLTLVAVFDLLAAALSLYVLLPDDVTQNFAVFFVVYIGAIAAGILSHTPGGIGVFEATLIAGLGVGGRADILAALVLYRLIYTLLPFLIATLGLALVWALSQRRALGQVATWSYKIAKPVVPMVSAGIALIAGIVLLVSGNLPGDQARLGLLRDILPLSIVEASHMMGSIAGVLLIVISRGLFRRLYRAWMIAMVTMGVGLFASLAKGLDWKEALSLFASIGLLGMFRSAFYRTHRTSVFSLNATWIVSVIALLAAIFWVGLFAYSHVAYKDTLWWDFAWRGDASRFLRASLAVAIILVAVGLNSFVSGRVRPQPVTPIPDRVRELLRQSEDSEAQLALTGDKLFLVAEDGRAFLSYADSGKYLIVKGDPVGISESGSDLIWRLREMADTSGRRCAFYSVSPAYLPTYLDLGLSILKIGEVAKVDLTNFTLEGSTRKDFRHAKSRAARDGYAFSILPAAIVPAALAELRKVSDAWLASKRGEEKAFALGFFDDAYLSNFDHAVIRRVETGEIVAFANLLQGANRHELSLDLMRYDPAGPSFAMDALFGELMLWAKDEGFHWFSLGAAPFAGIENHQLASLWNRIGSFVYEHGEHFYHFEGLRSFKQKFDPVWTPNYLASPGGLAVPGVLYEVNTLISGGLRGLMK